MERARPSPPIPRSGVSAAAGRGGESARRRILTLWDARAVQKPRFSASSRPKEAGRNIASISPGWVFWPSAGCGAGDARLCWRRLRPEAPPARLSKSGRRPRGASEEQEGQAGRTRGKGRASRREIAEKQNAIIHLFLPSFAVHRWGVKPCSRRLKIDIVSWELRGGSYSGLISV